ncbi:reverse transcriptase [Senna tora]|uniref:Reverse transcriptase n=1 Tax=Senna tora TaxID=362788 RepID=A0A834XEV7_9FABA|nr:reverse transcriptase [Senna tora]
MEDAGFMDMNLKGCKFTWCNNYDEGCVRERINICLVNGPWCFCFPHAWLEAIPATELDHSPIILRFWNGFRVQQKPFKFDQYWLENEQCIPIIQEAWQKGFVSSNLKAVGHKLGVVSGELKIGIKSPLRGWKEKYPD